MHGVLERDKSRSTGATAGKAGAQAKARPHGDVDAGRTLMTHKGVLTLWFANHMAYLHLTFSTVYEGCDEHTHLTDGNRKK